MCDQERSPDGPGGRTPFSWRRMKRPPVAGRASGAVAVGRERPALANTRARLCPEGVGGRAWTAFSRLSVPPSIDSLVGGSLTKPHPCRSSHA